MIVGAIIVLAWLRQVFKKHRQNTMWEVFYKLIATLVRPNSSITGLLNRVQEFSSSASCAFSCSTHVAWNSRRQFCVQELSLNVSASLFVISCFVVSRVP